MDCTVMALAVVAPVVDIQSPKKAERNLGGATSCLDTMRWLVHLPCSYTTSQSISPVHKKLTFIDCAISMIVPGPTTHAPSVAADSVVVVVVAEG